jgi:phosphatidylserine/phosphatidylglycerophosphate/cardiolipin synthase-like enzyme
MKLIVQPDMGIAPIVTAIDQAKKTIDILIFRLDRVEVTRALEAAVARGVNVRALIAHTNHGGDKMLRQLELQLLAVGVAASRTANDLVRYHGKMMIVDNHTLHVYGFNYTGLDIERSRSFGLIVTEEELVKEAAKLYEADTVRQPYTANHESLVVSPENARERLAAFVEGAKRQLLVYDPHVSDEAMLRVLVGRINAGVEVRIIGRVDENWNIPSERYPGQRLHVRAILRDGREAFVGSQSLRRLELEQRREVGIIVRDERIAAQIAQVFEQDWALTSSGRKEAKKAMKGSERKAPARVLAAAS